MGSASGSSRGSSWRLPPARPGRCIRCCGSWQRRSSCSSGSAPSATRSPESGTVHVVDVPDPADPRLDDLRDLNNSDRRPDLPGGRGLVVAEGTYVVARMLLSRFTPHVLLGTDARLAQLRREAAAEGWDADDEAGQAGFLRASREGISEVIGFRSSRDILAAAERPAPLPVADVVDGARVRASHVSVMALRIVATRSRHPFCASAETWDAL